jgi:sensor domain CHASE-containing protein
MAPSSRWSRLVTWIAGAVVAALGLAVIVGWHTGNRAILQPFPGLIAPVYNTALSFLLCGAGLMAIALGWPRLALPCGGIAALVSLLNVAQHAFGVDLGIDQLLMEHFITTQTSHPGRMAPNTAVCFVLAATALLLEGARVPARRRAPIVGLLGSVIVALGAVAISGYLAGVQTYGWGSFLPMAPQTASGFAVLGLGVMAAAWRDGRAEALAAPRWLPIPVGVAVVTATLCLWQPMVSGRHAQIERTTAAEVAGLAHVIKAEMEVRVLPLIRMARRWEMRGQPARGVWEQDVQLILGHSAEFQAIEWDDPARHDRWVFPPRDHAADRDRDVAGEPRRRQVLAEARDRRVVRIRLAAEGARGDPALLVAVPIGSDGNPGGAILGVIRLRDLFAAILTPDVAPGYAITVADGPEDLFGRDAGSPLLAEEWGREGEVAISGGSWRVRAWPGPELLARSWSSVPEVMMVVGVLLAILLAWAVHLTQNLRRTLQTIREAVAQLASTSAELVASTAQQTAGLQQQAAAVAQTVAAINQVAESSAQAAERARGVGNAIRRTLAIGQAGRQAVEDSSSALGDVQRQVESTARDIVTLAERAQAIGEIIAAVDDIAEQTNLLALNAAIEAARAGEHGLGFAVVAREVKALADQSKAATVQVRQILGEIQRATQTSVLSTEEVTRGVGAAIGVGGQAGAAIKTLAETLAETARAAEQIVASSTQQALGMAQVNQAMQDVAQVEGRNDAAIRQFEQAARDLNTLSTRLAALVATGRTRAG